MTDTTILNTTPAQVTEDSGAGWAVALIIALAVIVGGLVWYRYYSPYANSAPSNPTTTNINVIVPLPSTGGTETKTQ